MKTLIKLFKRKPDFYVGCKVSFNEETISNSNGSLHARLCYEVVDIRGEKLCLCCSTFMLKSQASIAPDSKPIKYN